MPEPTPIGLHVRVTEEMKRDIDNIAEEEGLRPSDIIRRALRLYLADYEA